MDADDSGFVWAGRLKPKAALGDGHGGPEVVVRGRRVPGSPREEVTNLLKGETFCCLRLVSSVAHGLDHGALQAARLDCWFV